MGLLFMYWAFGPAFSRRFRWKSQFVGCNVLVVIWSRAYMVSHVTCFK
jgi:hypothetical protein